MQSLAKEKVIVLAIVFSKAIYVGIFVICCLLVSYIVEGTNKGVDWTDEAWVYEMNANLNLQHNQTWGFQYFGHIFILLTDGNLLYLRALRLLFFILINYFLAYVSLKYFFRRNTKNISLQLISGLISCVSLYFCYTQFPRTFGYNEMAVWTTSLIFINLIRMKEVVSDNSAKFTKILTMLLGILNASLFFMKFTTGIFMIILTGAYLFVIFRQVRSRNTFWWFRYFVTGFLIVPVLIQILSGQAGFYLRNLYIVATSSSAQTDYAHPISEILHGYFSQFKAVAWGLVKISLFPTSLVIILATLSLLWIKHSKQADLKVLIPILYLTNLLFIFIKSPFIIESKWNSIGNFIISIFMLNSVFLIVSMIRREIDVCDFFIATFLNALPFIQAFGTSNSIGGQTMIGSAGVFIVIILIISKFLPKSLAFFLTAVILMCLSIKIAPSVIHGNTIGMYRVPSIDQLNSKIKGIAELRDVYVTKQDKIHFEWLVKEVAKVPIDSVFVPLVIPGYNYALVNRGFGAAWTDKWWPVSYSNLRISCQQGLSVQKEIVFVIPTEATPEFIESINRALNGCGIALPRDFTLVGKDPTHTTGIWRQK